jgi:L,D-transpeptidase YcbB
VVVEGPKLKPGSSHPNIALLRQRLQVPAPAAAADAEGNPAELFDPTLVEAVKTFQKENGLRIDGIVTKQLRQALNGDKVEPRDKRMERLLANMERWRWTPSDWGTSYVHNNIPEFMTRLYRDGQVKFAERIVVGKPVTPTSIFSDRFEYVDFNPRWNVPNSIKVNEIWPAMQRMGAAAALRRQGLKVDLGNGKVGEPDSVNWGSVDIRSVAIFQPTSTTFTCTTRRQRRCSMSRRVRSAMAVCACAILNRLRSPSSAKRTAPASTRSRLIWPPTKTIRSS